MLWAYKTTPHSSTMDTPFRLTYEADAVILVEIKEPSQWTESPLEEEMNDEAIRVKLYLVEELQSGEALLESKLKQEINLCHNAKVRKCDFEVDTLVLCRNMKDSCDGKFSPNWEGAYRVRQKWTKWHTTIEATPLAYPPTILYNHDKFTRL